MARGPLDGPAPALKASLIRDTVVMPGLTYLTVRYIVDSPGVWCVLRLDGCLAVGKVRGWVGVASSAGTPLTSLTPSPPPPLGLCTATSTGTWWPAWAGCSGLGCEAMAGRQG